MSVDARSRSQTISSLGEYDTSKSLPETMYLAYPSSGYASDQARAGPVTYECQPDQMSCPPNPLLDPRAKHNLTQHSFAGTESRDFLEVTSYRPDQGPQGSYVYVYIETSYDLAENPLNLSLMFATRHCMPTLYRLEARGTRYAYILAAEAPSYVSTGWASSNVPLRLQIQDVNGYDAGSLEVGSFFYTDGVQSANRTSPQDFSRKRKMSPESAGLPRVPSKRPSTQNLAESTTQYIAAPYVADQKSIYPYSSYPSTSVYAPSHIRPSTGPQATSVSLQSTPSLISGNLQKPTHHGSTPSSRSSAWSSPFTSTSKSNTNKSPALSGTSSSSRLQALGSPNTGNPQLIRTSTLPPPHGSNSSSENATYAYGYKAILSLNGDLNTMTEGWSNEEIANKRRLVRFWRSQNKNTIEADFDVVPAGSSPPVGICISCIWWEERQECYVTSVDTIHLLESLVAVRFTVEEKNRIRRNLEGYRPTTVSKAKSDSEDFFSVIMGFPNPKPRNIEKDVKVFQWKILNQALAKIIGKYVGSPANPISYPSNRPQTASYSSTASAMLTPQNSGYGTHSDQPLRPTISPRTDSSSSSSTYTATNMMSLAALSPRASQSRPRIPSYSQSPPFGQVTTPTDLSYTYTVSPLPAQYASEDQAYASSAQIPPLAMQPRASWDLAPYINPNSQMQATILPTTQADSTHSVR